MKILFLLFLFPMVVFSKECDTTTFKIVAEYKGLSRFVDGVFYSARGPFTYDASAAEKNFYKRDSSCFEISGLDRKSLQYFSISSRNLFTKERSIKDASLSRWIFMEMGRILNHGYNTNDRYFERYIPLVYLFENNVHYCVFLVRSLMVELDNDGKFLPEARYSCVALGIDGEFSLMPSENCQSLLITASKKMTQVKWK